MKKAIILSLSLFLFLGCKTNTNQFNKSLETAEKGKQLFTNLGCSACHSITGEKLYGPSLNNILNKKVEVVRNGELLLITVDKEYLTKSIQDPAYEKVSSLKSHKMPKPEISAEDINCLVEYIISVNSTGQ